MLPNKEAETQWNQQTGFCKSISYCVSQSVKLILTYESINLVHKNVFFIVECWFWGHKQNFNINLTCKVGKRTCFVGKKLFQVSRILTQNIKN